MVREVALDPVLSDLSRLFLSKVSDSYSPSQHQQDSYIIFVVILIGLIDGICYQGDDVRKDKSEHDQEVDDVLSLRVFIELDGDDLLNNWNIQIVNVAHNVLFQLRDHFLLIKDAAINESLILVRDQRHRTIKVVMQGHFVIQKELNEVLWDLLIQHACIVVLPSESKQSPDKVVIKVWRPHEGIEGGPCLESLMKIQVNLVLLLKLVQILGKNYS